MTVDYYKIVDSIPDFPEKGIIYRDIMPLMANGEAFHQAIGEIVDYAKGKKVDMVVGPEARGFIVGCPIAYELLQPGRRASCHVKQSALPTSWNTELPPCRWKRTPSSLANGYW